MLGLGDETANSASTSCILLLFKDSSLDPTPGAAEETSLREMIHEMKLLSTINHPRILGLIGAGFERTAE